MAKDTDTKLDTETAATPANLIMAGCELDSLTDGPEQGGKVHQTAAREGWRKALDEQVRKRTG